MERPCPPTKHFDACAAVPERSSLVQFLMRLLKRVQSLATAPAIDYEADLARLQADGGGTR